MIKVTCAIILFNSKILVTQRAEKMSCEVVIILSSNFIIVN